MRSKLQAARAKEQIEKEQWMNDNVNWRLQRVGNCGAMLFSVVNTSLDLSAQIEGWSA